MNWETEARAARTLIDEMVGNPTPPGGLWIKYAELRKANEAVEAGKVKDIATLDAMVKRDQQRWDNRTLAEEGAFEMGYNDWVPGMSIEQIRDRAPLGFNLLNWWLWGWGCKQQEVTNGTCPDCGRIKAKSGGQLTSEAYCPKWFAIRDPEAVADCNRVKAALPSAT